MKGSINIFYAAYRKLWLIFLQLTTFNVDVTGRIYRTQVRASARSYKS